MNNELIKRICDYADVKSKDTVLEIGAGTGNLTAELIKRAKFVYAVEKDKKILETLYDRFQRCENIKIIHGDALKIEFPKFNKIVSNLPYSISKKITIKFLKYKFDRAILLYQKEFVDKLIAKSGTDNYRFISALVQSVADVEFLENVPPAAFQPRPRVWSALIKIVPKRIPDNRYIEFLKTLFNYKNKKIINILKDKNIPKKYADSRSINLNPEELLGLYSRIY